jgi:hypothetical protein
MSRYLHALIAALATLALCAPLAVADDDDDGHTSGNDDPTVSLLQAEVRETSAVLKARVGHGDDDHEWIRYRFEYGIGSYAEKTDFAYFWDDDPRDVAVEVANLSVGSVYRFRAVAWVWDDDEWDDRREMSGTFTTARNSTDGGAGGPLPEPTLGRTVVAQVTDGEVYYREKGAAEFQPLDSAAELPVNSTLDTTEGTVVLETALRGGESQTGTFRGGQFQVRQPASAGGMTTIALRGGDFSVCDSKSRATTKLLRKGGTVRKLWAKDKGGRFKTSGKGSVATVRGTSWFTADRCDGTLTRVTRGAVLVRERGTGERKLLTRGESFLAQLPAKRGG